MAAPPPEVTQCAFPPKENCPKGQFSFSDPNVTSDRTAYLLAFGKIKKSLKLI
jgi:hypothetical protein